jgi:eukaryotic-like serine/threonine-protein kinase
MSDEERTDTDEILSSGDLIGDGKYKILSLVGAGGMGKVYKAKHTLLGRTVAIKVLHPGLGSDAKIEARFLREARATSRLDHRNAMQVLDFGSEKRGERTRLLYIVMEFIQGHELTDTLNLEGPLTTDRIAQLMSQVCAALFMAHEEGIVHRDLKPENIMIVVSEDDDGRTVERVKVCDFGIAKLQSSGEYDGDPGTKLTEAGEIFGTPPYMSPEQARGKKMDARSDIYSLGVVLFEMGTGRLPFVGENMMGILTQHLTDLPPNPRDIYPEIDPRLEQIILKCLEKEPESRYQSVRDLRVELQNLLSQRPASTPSMSGVDLGRAETLRADSGPSGLTQTAPMQTADPSNGAKTAPFDMSQGPRAEEKRNSRLPLLIVILVLLVLGVAGAMVYMQSPSDVARDRGSVTTKTRSTNEILSTASGDAGGEVDTASDTAVARVDTKKADGGATIALPEQDSDPAQSPGSSKRRRPRNRKETVDDSATEPSKKTETPTQPEPVVEEKPVVEPVAQPIPEPTPAIEPPPKPKPTPTPAKSASLDARVGTSLVSVRGSLPKAPIKRGVGRVTNAYRACYRQAATRAGRDWSGQVSVKFTIDVDGRAREPKASGGGLPGLDSCVRGATSKVRSSTRPDTGTVQIEVNVRFTPVD